MKLLERSNKVIATARVPADAQQLQQLAKENSNLTIAALDISQPDSIAAFAAEVKKHTAHVDVSAAVLSGTTHSADLPAWQLTVVAETAHEPRAPCLCGRAVADQQRRHLRPPWGPDGPGGR